MNLQQGSISLQGMSIDCLNTAKHFSLVDSFNSLESSNPQVRQAFSRTAQDHKSMAEDWFQLMHRRGWYQVPDARPEIKSQVSNFINSLQSNIGAQQTTAGQQTFGQTFGGYGQQNYGTQTVAQQGGYQGSGMQAGQKYLR